MYTRTEKCLNSRCAYDDRVSTCRRRFGCTAISYYLQNVYGWKHERENVLGVESLDEHEHIESLSKNGNQLVLFLKLIGQNQSL